MRTAPRVAPSVLSADLTKLGDEVREVEPCADIIHVDVMDGHFVPNIALGSGVVSALRRVTTKTLDCHLMISNPDCYLKTFADAGADIITVHAEAALHLQRTLSTIRSLGKRAGVALCPHTSEELLRYIVGDIDLVLVMCVNPGFAGQAFLPTMLEKIVRVRRLIDDSGLPIALEVDGGIGPATAESVTRAGAEILVASAAVFGERNRQAAVGKILEASLRGTQS